MIQGGGRKFYPGRHFVFEIISTTDRQTHTQTDRVTYGGGAHLKIFSSLQFSAENFLLL